MEKTLIDQPKPLDDATHCCGCRFYKSAHNLKEPGQGICRRRSPTVVPLQGPRGELLSQGLWPPVREEFWCGEHELKPSPLALSN